MLFLLIVAPFKNVFLYVETCLTIQKLIFDNTKDVCPSMADNVFEFETVFCCLIFWRFLF